MAYDYKPPIFRTIGYKSGYIQIKTLNCIPYSETITAIINIAKREPGNARQFGTVWKNCVKLYRRLSVS